MVEVERVSHGGSDPREGGSRGIDWQVPLLPPLSGFGYQGLAISRIRQTFEVNERLSGAISTYGGPRVTPTHNHKIMIAPFNGEVQTSVGPQDGVWLYTPDKFNSEGIDVYLARLIAEPAENGKTVVSTEQTCSIVDV